MTSVWKTAGMGAAAGLGKPGVLRLERSNGGFVFPLAPKPPASVLPTSRSGCVARNR